MERTFPSKGLYIGSPSSKQPPRTSRNLKNMRPYYDGRAVGGQRPGLNKKFVGYRVGGGAFPIVASCSVTVVD